MVPLLHEVGSEKVKQEFQPYCEGVPKTSKLSMAFDLYHEELRTLPISVRIVESTEGKSSSGNTILAVPPIIYSDGTVRVDTEIPKTGHYVAVLKLEKVGSGIAHKPHRGSEIGEWHRVKP